MVKKNNEEVQKLVAVSNQVSRSTMAVIDAIAARGAFKGEELSTIGQLRDQCAQLMQLAENIQNELNSGD